MTLAFRPRLAAAVATHRLEGEIGAATGDALAAFLEAHEGRPVRVIINSPDGIATEGAAMAVKVERHGQVTALGQGVVASAATWPVLAPQRAVLHWACLVMIHDPAALVIGNAAALRSWADEFDTIGEAHAAAYARWTGHPVARVLSWMRDETWLSAADALALGFADAIEARPEAVAVARFDYGVVRHAPEALVRMTRDKG